MNVSPRVGTDSPQSATALGRMRTLIFPVAALLNSFSTTALLLVFGLAGRPEIAADIALVQAASLALFYAFSANARNLVLAAENNAGEEAAGALLSVRAVLMLPLAFATYVFGVVVGGAAASVAMVLIARRMAEWIGEIALARHERLGQHRQSFHSLFAEAGFLALAVVLSLGFSTDLALSTLPWALAPLVAIRGAGLSFSGHRLDLRTLLPHLGSTAIIGASVYVFRLSISLLAGKTVAGILFTAFALGGLVPTVFGQALAPTLMRKYGASNRLPSLFLAIPGAMLVVGAGLVAGIAMNPSWNPEILLPPPFLMAAGLSLCGGAIMSMAALLRTRLIHGDDGREVFGPDLLANVLLTSCVPFAFHAFGPDAFSGLYLFGACLSLFFLWGAGHQRGVSSEYHGVMLSVIGVVLTLPFFFQLDGGLFSDPAFVFETEGVLLRVPLPVSLLAVFCGIALLGNYKTASRGLAVLFFSALLFVMTSLVAAKGNADYEGAKLALLAQYLIPMFGLVLGEMYGAAARGPVFERAACWVLVIILPAQLLSTWLQGYVLLSPKVAFFSIYQHLQYFPMIVSALSILAVLSLWGRATRPSPLAGGLLMIASVYVVAANSLGALVGLMITWAGFLFLYCRGTKLRFQSIAILAAAVVGAALFAAATSSGWLARAVATTAEPSVQMSWDSKLSVMLPRGDGDSVQSAPRHMDYWHHYVGEILESPRTLLVGHPTPPDRRQYSSAHNYWLDVAYNFGLLALLPVLGMLAWTLRALWLRRDLVIGDSLLLATALAFIYLFLLENLLKVGLRQPYPGILSYFIWGLLIFRIRSLPAARGKAGEEVP